MKNMLAILLAAAMLLLAGAAALADAEITALGTAVVTANPDIVSVTASASVTANSVMEAQTQISHIIADTTDKLLALGVQEDDIVTQNYTVYPVYNYDEGTQKLDSYRASHSLQVTCRDVLMLDGVISAMTDSGMDEIYNVSYDVSNRTQLYQDALALAIEAAGEKAARMAQAAGLQLGEVESLTENVGSDYGYVMLSAADVMGAAQGTGIRSGDVSVSASVTAVYEAR